MGRGTRRKIWQQRSGVSLWLDFKQVLPMCLAPVPQHSDMYLECGLKLDEASRRVGLEVQGACPRKRD